jgi:prepilin peptidase CpaA
MNHDTAAATLTGITLLLGILVSRHDLRERRIPNVLLVIALALALGVFVALGAFSNWITAAKGIGYGLFGMLLGAAFLVPGYAARQLGAGDVKLLMTFGFLLGPLGAVLTLLIGAIVGGVWALALSWKHGGIGQLLSNLKLMAGTAWASGFRDMGWDLRSAGAVRMPYGVALSAGAGTVALWQLHRLAA